MSPTTATTLEKKKKKILYFTWYFFRLRCNDPLNPQYKDYGGRGITVCSRWNNTVTGFISFCTDMAPTYKPKLTLDRTNNEKGYSPKNCRWVTQKEQQQNRRPKSDAHWIEYKGERLQCSEWARRMGILHVTLYSRLKHHGWPVEKALSLPVQKKYHTCRTKRRRPRLLRLPP